MPPPHEVAPRRTAGPNVAATYALGALCVALAACGYSSRVGETVVAPATEAAYTAALTASATRRPTATETIPVPTVTTTYVREMARPSYTPSPTFTASPSCIPSLSPTPTIVPPLVVIDPGHGGRDLGARHFDQDGHMDYSESEVNLALAVRTRDLLLERGYRVLLTREGDNLVNRRRLDINGDGQIDHVDESQARVDMINAAGPDLLLSIHQNAFYGSQGEPAEDVGGTVTFYCADRAFSDRNLRFAQLVQDAVVEAFRDAGHDVRDRGVEQDLVLKTPDEPGSYLILLGPKTERIVRPCQVPGALSETMFLTHRGEGELARDPAMLDRLALAYTKAICGYFEED